MRHKTNLLLMATSIGLHVCKLLRSSLSIYLEFAPHQTNQEFYMKALFSLSKMLAADCRIYHKINSPSFIYLKGSSAEVGIHIKSSHFLLSNRKLLLASAMSKSQHMRI